MAKTKADDVIKTIVIVAGTIATVAEIIKTSLDSRK
jgi:hypothetical protein